MNSGLERAASVLAWYRLTNRALDVFEVEARERPEQHLQAVVADSKQLVLAGIGTCRDELENFALLTLWSMFEETINEWLVGRVRWMRTRPEGDPGLQAGLERQLRFWRVSEKIDALGVLIGADAAKDLQTVRQWRDWVAHRKTDARPTAVDFETAQSLIAAALNALDECPTGEAVGLA